MAVLQLQRKRGFVVMHTCKVKGTEFLQVQWEQRCVGAAHANLVLGCMLAFCLAAVCQAMSSMDGAARLESFPDNHVITTQGRRQSYTACVIVSIGKQ